MIMAGAGLVSFLLSNLTGLRQQSAKRLLGYSSTAQTGLIIFVMTGLARFGIDPIFITYFAAGLFITNFFAKAGLFWLTGVAGTDKISEWGSLRKYPLLLILFGVFVLALTGFPPFPLFLVKWEIVKILSSESAWLPLGTILIGSLLEAGYMFKWLGLAIKNDTPVHALPKDLLSRIIPITLAGITLVVLSFQNATDFYHMDTTVFLPILGLLVFAAIDTLSVKIKGFLTIAVLAAWGWLYLMPYLSGLGLLFGGILVAGTLVQIFGFMHHKGAQRGLFPLLVMMVISLGNILVASSKLTFFFGWELMTLSSYLLVTRGKLSFKPAFTYIMFSLAGAYLLLTGLNLIPAFVEGIPLYAQAVWMNIGVLPAILLSLGFLIKLGALGVHVWLPDAYAEAEDEFTAILSSVLSKAGVFGLLLVLIMARSVFTSSYFLTEVLGWVGVLTAFFGALMAVFQEDVKKLLAYSSMSQLGYIVLSFSLMSHLGWVSALYMTVNHFFFKALILMAIAGVIYRTKTRWMYEMGGLIKKMPISFISVLLGIIAVSGVPPLSGFGGKWLVYTSLMEKGHYLQAGLAFFSSAVAFLYLYRLIHTVFLGQAKPMFKDVKESPVWLLIPQIVFMMLIMGISMFPNLITMPLSGIVNNYIPKPEWLSWTGYNITLNGDAIHGNWNGNLVMMVTMGVFIVPLAWLMLVVGKVQKVKQFNIVFAAERPYKPWTTHFAYNMFAPYYKALGFLVQPRATAFWNGVGEWSRSLSSTIAHLYTGNGQTYLLHIFMYIIVLYFAGGVY
jgi:formate hydrogenlyase subunit 3/multisubunit Na+/H+ antiporter MnhD subunit